MKKRGNRSWKGLERSEAVKEKLLEKFFLTPKLTIFSKNLKTCAKIGSLSTTVLGHG